MNGKTDCMPPCLIKVFSAHQHCIAHQVTRIKIWIIKYSIVKIVKALISFHSYFYIDYPIIKWKKQNIHEQSFRTNITSYAYTIRPRLIFFFFGKKRVHLVLLQTILTLTYIVNSLYLKSYKGIGKSLPDIFVIYLQTMTYSINFKGTP